MDYVTKGGGEVMPKRWSVVSAGSVTEDEATVGAEAGGCRITAKDDGWPRPVIFPGIFKDSAEASAAIEEWRTASVEDICNREGA
jgi:hypothetical protein